jgi:predicted YcjX-like family ATPase
MKAGALACLLAVTGLAKAGQPVFITTPPQSVIISTQAQGPLRTTSAANQATMSQIINQLNQRQFQLKVAAAQTAPQRAVFVPQRVTVKSGK